MACGAVPRKRVVAIAKNTTNLHIRFKIIAFSSVKEIEQQSALHDDTDDL